MNYSDNFNNQIIEIDLSKKQRSLITIKKIQDVSNSAITLVSGKDGIGTKVLDWTGDKIQQLGGSISNLATNLWNDHVAWANRTWSNITDWLTNVLITLGIISKQVQPEKDLSPPEEPIVPSITAFNPVYTINRLEEKWIELSIAASEFVNNFDYSVISDPTRNNFYDVDALKARLKRKVMEAL